MSMFSIGSFQSTTSALSGQSRRSVLSWQSNGGVMQSRSRGPLARRRTSRVVVGLAVLAVLAVTRPVRLRKVTAL
jgi:hypothetical protein